MLAQQVDAKLLPRLGEAEQPVQCDDVGEDAPASIVVHHVEELERHLPAWPIREIAGFGGLCEVVDTLVLMVECRMQDATSGASPREHAADKLFEIDITMVELVGDGPLELYLIRLKACRQP